MAGYPEIEKSRNSVPLEKLQVNNVVTQAILQGLAEDSAPQASVIENQAMKVRLERLESAAQKHLVEVVSSEVSELYVRESVENLGIAGRLHIDGIRIVPEIRDPVHVDTEIRGKEAVIVVANFEAEDAILVHEVIVEAFLAGANENTSGCR